MTEEWHNIFTDLCSSAYASPWDPMTFTGNNLRQDGKIKLKIFCVEGAANNVWLSSSKEVPYVLFSVRYVAASLWSSVVIRLLLIMSVRCSSTLFLNNSHLLLKFHHLFSLSLFSNTSFLSSTKDKKRF